MKGKISSVFLTIGLLPVAVTAAMSLPAGSSPPGPARLMPQAAEPTAWILKNAWLIDGTGAPVREKAWVRVEGKQIVAVGQGTAPAVPGARVLDLTGKTLLPGLSDMHAHLGTAERAPWVMKLLLAHGITMVRDTGNELGNLAAIVRDLQGREEMPHFYYGGPMMNGSFADRSFLREGSRLQMMLEEITAFGVHFLKHHHWITTAAMEQIARHAQQHDLTLVGHVPLTMTSVKAIDTGLQILEHIRMPPSEILDDPELVALFPIDVPFMRRKGYWAHFDPQGRVLQKTLDAYEKRKDKFFIDPTLVVEEVTAHRYDPDRPPNPHLPLVSPAVRRKWAETPPARWGDLSPREIEEARASVRGMKRFVGMAHARGVRILTGSDVLMADVVPGPSLHRELELLAEGGINPVDVIHCSTGRAAEALRLTDRGTVAAGQLADLVIVPGPVATDISLVRRLEQVMLEGKLLEKSRLLQEAARLAEQHVRPSYFHPF